MGLDHIHLQILHFSYWSQLHTCSQKSICRQTNTCQSASVVVASCSSSCLLEEDVLSSWLTHTNTQDSQGENNSSHTLSLLVETREGLWREMEAEIPICCRRREEYELRMKKEKLLACITSTSLSATTTLHQWVLMCWCVPHATQRETQRCRNSCISTSTTHMKQHTHQLLKGRFGYS